MKKTPAKSVFKNDFKSLNIKVISKPIIECNINIKALESMNSDDNKPVVKNGNGMREGVHF